MENQQEPTVEDVINKLPRSVVDKHEDGSVSIHAVDMVQAQMDREKEFNVLSQRLAAAIQHIKKLEGEATVSDTEASEDVETSTASGEG